MDNKTNTTVAEATRAELEQIPLLSDMLGNDIINYRGLARHLREQVLARLHDRDSIRIESIVMAIKRFEETYNTRNGDIDKIQSVIADSSVTLVSDVLYLTVHRTKDGHQAVIDCYQSILDNHNDHCHLLHSDDEIGFICRRDHQDLIDQHSPPIKKKEEDIAMVMMESPSSILSADGIIAYLTGKIAGKGISLIDMATTYTETVFLVPADESATLYQLLRSYITQMRDRD